MVQANTSSFSLFLRIGTGNAGTSFTTIAVASARVIFTANAKNVAMVYLPVGNWVGNNTTNKISMFRGQIAQLVVANSDSPNLRNGTLFSGYVYDFGPTSTSFGSFSMAVYLFSDTHILASGTLQTSALIPSSYLGDSEYWNSEYDTAATTGGAGSANQPKMMVDYAKQGFGNEFIRTLEAIASGGGTPVDSYSKFLSDTFHTGINGAALSVLGRIDASMLYIKNSIADRNELIWGLVQKINDVSQVNWVYNSFMDRMLQLAKSMQFGIVELGGTVYMVPSVPFFPQSDALTITPDTYQQVQMGQDSGGVLREFSGAVLTHATGTYLRTQGSGAIIGAYSPKGFGTSTGLGTSVVVHGPGVSGGASDYTAGQVMTVAIDPLFVLGWDTSTDNKATSQAVVTNVSRGLGNDLAKVVYWNAKYLGRSYTVSSPYFRSDIAPLTPVKLMLPAQQEIAASLESAIVYGQVQSVSVGLDATQMSAQTDIEIGFVRTQGSQVEMDREITSRWHPIFSSNWKGSDLYGRPR